MRERHSTVSGLQNERIVGMSAVAVLPFLDNWKCPQFVERVHAEERREQEPEVAKALPVL